MARKQLVVFALVLVIITAGVLQYTYNKTSSSDSNIDNNRLGEAVYVDTQNSDGESDADSTVSNVDGDNSDYFAQARLEREKSRGKDKEELKSITADTNASKEDKSEAYDKIIDLVKQSEKEMNVESLIKQRGFKDAIVFFGEDESVDVIIKASSLSAAQTAQICDIVTRHCDVDISNIHIKNMN